MTTDWKKLLAIVDNTFSFAERRLSEVREETIAHMREQLTHSTQATPEELNEPVPPTR